MRIVAGNASALFSSNKHGNNGRYLWKQESNIMKNKNLFAAIFSAAILSLMVLIMPQASSAQGRYATQYSKAQVGQIIANLETSSGDFRSNFDRAMDNSNYNGTRDEDRFNGYIKSFDKEVNELRRDYNRNNNWWDIRNQVESVIRQAGPVNNMMNSISFRRNLERQWNKLRNDINKLADTFDMRGINGGGWNGGPWNPGNGNGNGNGGNWNAVTPPSWARGTFYGTAPNGERIVLTINRNGSVTSQVGYGVNRGVYTRNNMLYINGMTSKVENTRNGIRTVQSSNREIINYSKNNNGGGWDGGGGGVGNAPSWAVGRFSGRNPQNGQPITLNIDKNGRVSVNIGGGMSYGTINGSTLTINGESSTVTRTRNGITTVSNRDGERINYSKY